MELDWVQLIVLLPAVLTIIWAVITFTVEWQTRQRAEQKRLSALYINPFLLACEELQSRLLNLLEKGGLGALRVQDPEGLTSPQETLYLLAQYFGWERYNFRYGPYAQDREVYRLTEAIRDTFATDKVQLPRAEGGTGLGTPAEALPGALAEDSARTHLDALAATRPTPAKGRPFNFYRYQQKALAQIVLKSSEGPAGQQAETVPLSDFREQCEDLVDWLPSVKDTLAALGKDGAPARIHPLAWGRLAEVQNHLVTLLAYLESKEGFSLFMGKRETCERRPEWEEWAKGRSWSRASDDEELNP